MYGKYKIASEDLSVNNRTENTEKTMILLEIDTVLFLESLGWIFSHKKKYVFFASQVYAWYNVVCPEW